MPVVAHIQDIPPKLKRSRDRNKIKDSPGWGYEHGCDNQTPVSFCMLQNRYINFETSQDMEGTRIRS